MQQGHLTPLVGREVERAALADVLTSAGRGHGSAVIITGEAGIGKSALLADAIHNAGADFAVMCGKAEELERRVPFAALTALLEGSTVSDAAADLVELVRAARRGAGRADGSIEFDFPISEAATSYVEEVSSRTPLIVALDDAHWADPSTLRVLLPIVRLVPQLPVAFIVLTRPAPNTADLESFLHALTSRGVTEVRLGALAPEAVGAFAEAALQAKVTSALDSELQAAGGNPLFIGVILDALRESGDLVIADGVADVGRDIVAPTVPVTILERLRMCTPGTLEVLTIAAVLGSRFTAADLAAGRGCDLADVVPAVREGLRARILYEEGDSLAFQHDLIRETLYRDLPASIRNELHVSLARAMAAAEAPPAVIAEHLLRGVTRGDGDNLLLLHSTAVAVVSSAPDLAVELLERAASLAEHAPEMHGAVRADLAIALLRSGRVEEGEAACRDAIARRQRPTIPADLRFALARSLGSRGLVAEALALAEAGMADPASTEAQRTQLHTFSAGMRLLSGDLAGAETTGRASLPAAEETGDLAGQSQAWNALAMAARLSGRLAEASEHARRSFECAEAASTFDAHHHVPGVVYSLVLHEVDRSDEALAVCRRGMAAVERIGARDAIGWHHLQLAHGSFLVGAWDEAETETDLALEIAEQTGQGWMDQAMLLRAMMALHRNDLDEARMWRDRATKALADGGRDILPGATAGRHAAVLDAEGRFDAALELVSGAWEFVKEVGLVSELPWLAPHAVRLAVRADDDGSLLKRVADGLAPLAAANADAATLNGVAALARGLADSDLAMLMQGAEHYRRSPRPVERAAAFELIAEQLAMAGEVGDAVALLTDAIAAYGEADATGSMARVTAGLRDLGVRRGPRGSRPRAKTGWDALTRSELAVVELVAQHLSNPEIARRLYVSRRTVQTHVSHALAKLGVSSRRELAEIAAGRL